MCETGLRTDSKVKLFYKVFVNNCHYGHRDCCTCKPMCIYILFICIISLESKNKKLSGIFPNTCLFQEILYVLTKLLADVSEENLLKHPIDFCCWFCYYYYGHFYGLQCHNKIQY